MVKSSGFITLVTDFGVADGFVGTMKGVIYAINPDATIIDISHDIGSQDVSSASFLLGASYKYFPSGTVHLVVVDPGVGSQRRAVAVETEKYFFVAPDNGVLTRALAQEEVIRSVDLTNSEYFLHEVSSTFHGRDIFAPVAAHLSLGIDIEALGVEIDDLAQIPLSKPKVTQNGIKGSVIHIDKFGNLITDITRELFETVFSERQFVIKIAQIKLDRISHSYADIPAGHPLAIFDSFGNLEIAVNSANASKALGIHAGDDVCISIKL